MIQERKQRNSSKVNLIVSAVFHTVLILGVFFFAAREGLVGKRLKQLAVTMVPKEKKPEPPKEKPPEPKVETPKPPEAPKMAVPVPHVETVSAPPPPPAQAAPEVAAPAAAVLPDISFSDGAKAVTTITDANGVYKALVEHSLRSRWNRPEDMADDNFVVEVELGVDPSGNVKDYHWLSGSGNKRWDDSVKEALAQTTTISRPPPKGFPDKFTVRFDVESIRTEAVLNLSSSQ
jgi:protein TonB